MKVPHIISPNCCIAYTISPECLKINGEDKRILVSENLNWDSDQCPLLPQLCVEVISANFENKQILDDLPGQDKNYLLEILSLDLPLEIVVPLIDNEFYWKRKYEFKYDLKSRPMRTKLTWKNLFLKRVVEDKIEQAQPQYKDELNMDDTLDLCGPFVKALKITQLQAWKPPLTWDEEDIPEKWPVDHIDFSPIFAKLREIEEFNLIFGVSDIGVGFNWDMFRLSVQDCLRLGRSIQTLQNLSIVRIHRSNLKDDHIRALIQGLIKNQSIKELDLSHCLIGDEGAFCIAKLLTIHPTLEKLNLSGNVIRDSGAEAIAFALIQTDCMLNSLNLRLNPLGNYGVFALMRALVWTTKDIPTELSVAATQFDLDTAKKFGKVLKYNNTLSVLDISNNVFGEEAAQEIIEGFHFNRNLKWLDFRNTETPLHLGSVIREKLKRNRLGLDIDEEIVGELDEHLFGSEYYGEYEYQYDYNDTE